MAAPPLSNTAEGGSDTTTCTQGVGGNTGGVSGNFFDTVTPGTGATITFSATHAAHGSLAYQFAMGVTSSATRVHWLTLGAGANNIWFRFYLYMTALPNAQHQLLGVRTTTATASAQLEITTAGKIQCRNAAGTLITPGLDGATVMSANQWNRLEFRCKSLTTNGELEWRLYTSPDSTSITETKSSTTEVLGATSDEMRIGYASTPTPTSQTIWIDDIAASTTNWIGPSGATFTAPRELAALQAVNRSSVY